jgi:hypothetical protein
LNDLDLFKEASGLSIEFEQKSVDANRLDSVHVGLPEENLGQDVGFLSQSPQINFKY